MKSDEFLDELRSELMRAAHGPEGLPDVPAGRRRWIGRAWVAIGVAAALIAIVVVGSTALRDTRSAAADVQVLIDGDDLVVRLTDAEARPDEVEKAAAKFGLDVRVSEAPVGPSNVGRFLGSSGDRLPPALVPTGQSAGSFSGFRIPRGWPGTLDLTIGRAARPGEAWTAASDGLAKGEPAACMDLLGASIPTAERELSDADLTVRWFMLSPGEAEVPLSRLDDYADWKVVQVEAVGPSEVWVRATEDGSWRLPPPATAPTIDPRC